MNEKEDRMNELSCSARITLPKAKNVSKIHFNHIHSETKHYIPKERVLVRNDYPNLSSIQLNSHDYLLVMGISTDQSNVTQTVHNTIALMGLYQKHYSFKGIVFSSSSSVSEVAMKYNVSVNNDVKRNEYGLPYVNSLLEKMKDQFDARYYGYMNSDILLHPKVFDMLLLIENKRERNLIPDEIELSSRVKMINQKYNQSDFSSQDRLPFIFSEKMPGKLRRYKSSDVFIFSCSFPVKKIPPAVIGRGYIDNILFQTPSLINATGIDFTPYAVSLHQGMDGYTKHGYLNQDENDRFYNRPFVKRPLQTVDNIQYQLRNDSLLWE